MRPAALSRPLFFTLLFALVLSSVPPVAHGHLSVVRQGLESVNAPATSENFGATVAVGDFNGDGRDDLATASPGEDNDISGGNKHGNVIINYGTLYGVTDTGAHEISIGAVLDNDVWFGRGLAAADFDDDGFDDLAVGAPGYDVAFVQEAGQVFVYRGSPTGLQSSPYIQLEQADAGGASESGDQFGYTLAAGDFTGDGNADLAVGAFGEDSEAGAVFIFFGSGTGITTSFAGWIKQSSLGWSNESGSRFGWALAAGDMLGDSHEDLAIAAPYRTVSSQSSAGQVYILKGSASGPLFTGFQVKTAESVGLDLQSSSWFGYSLATGHLFEPTGSVDLAIGEPSYDVAGVINAGRVVVLEFDSIPGRSGLSVVELTQNDVAGVPEAADGFGWALATGDLTGDGLDDLGVGAPSEDVVVGSVSLSDVGEVDVFPGSLAGPTGTDAVALTSEQLNDLYDFDSSGGNGRFGASLAFGLFDGSGRANLAIGVPDKNYNTYITIETPSAEAGQVDIYAPWRQPIGQPHRSSVVYDCLDRLVYSQRMDQRTHPASTTKVLTALIVCEAIQAGWDSTAFYTVPEWVATEVSGSQFGLFAGEEIRFIDLLKTLMAVSGNDCGYALGDSLTGGGHPWTDSGTTLIDFAVVMNDRAAQLGMSGSSVFTNPAGLGSSLEGNHWSTAADMAILMRAAMQNDLFIEMAGTTDWVISRRVPLGELLPWINIPGPIVEFDQDVSFDFLKSIQAKHPRTVATKPGSTKSGRQTAVFSADLQNPGDRVTATLFGVPGSLGYGGTRSGLGDQLLKLVDLNCNPQIKLPPGPPPIPAALVDLHGITTQDPSVHAASVLPGGANDGPVKVRVAREVSATPMANLNLAVSRVSEIELGPGESMEYGLDQIQKHAGIRLLNQGASATLLTLTLSHPTGTMLTASIAPEDDFLIAPYPPIVRSAGGGGPFNLVIQNISSLEAAHLTVEEQGYYFELTLGDGTAAPTSFETTLQRDESVLSDVMTVYVTGRDPIGSANTVGLVVGATEAVTDAPVVGAGHPDLLQLANFPNPFGRATTISYSLPHDGPARLAVYDVSGRLVATLADSPRVSAGSHRAAWNGTDGRGRRVASGVYFYRLEAGDLRKSKRMILLR